MSSRGRVVEMYSLDRLAIVKQYVFLYLRRRLWGLFAGIFGAILCLTPASLLAQTPPHSPRANSSSTSAAGKEASKRPALPWSRGVSRATQRLALDIFRRGNSFFERSRFSEALALYQSAIRHWDHPAIRFNMAVCWINLKRPLKAHEDLERALRFGSAPLRSHYQQALSYRRLLSERLARITIRCSLPGARVMLDGKLLFRAPGQVTRVVPTGEHVLLASRKDYVTLTRHLHVDARQHQRVKLTLLPMVVGLKMERRWPRVLPWMVLGAGLVLGAVGIPLLIDANAALDRFDRRLLAEFPLGFPFSQLPSDMQTQYERSQNEVRAGWTLVGIGGAVALTGAVLLIVNLPRIIRTPTFLSNNA